VRAPQGASQGTGTRNAGKHLPHVIASQCRCRMKSRFANFKFNKSQLSAPLYFLTSCCSSCTCGLRLLQRNYYLCTLQALRDTHTNSLACERMSTISDFCGTVTHADRKRGSEEGRNRPYLAQNNCTPSGAGSTETVLSSGVSQCHLCMINLSTRQLLAVFHLRPLIAVAWVSLPLLVVMQLARLFQGA